MWGPNLLITKETAESLLDYDKETGVFRWRRRGEGMFADGKQSAKKSCAIWNGRYAGKIAGSPHSTGYWSITLFGKKYFAHRLAVLIVAGKWPDDETDHQNLNRMDNRWDNLRLATSSQNKANTEKRSDNTSGFKGVVWDKERKKWRAQIRKNNKMKNLGRFDTAKAAQEVYFAAARRLSGDFARAG